MNNIILQTIKEILAIIGLEAEISVENKDDFLKICVQCPENGFLIGSHGEHLFALQHLLKAIFLKKDIRTSFILDINNYRQDRISLLENIARHRAIEALREKREVSLFPMPAFERKHLHLILSEIEGIKTESEGEGEERRIVIKPI